MKLLVAAVFGMLLLGGTLAIAQGPGKGPVTELVAGSAHAIRPVSENYRTFSFNARKFADGTVAGRFQMDNHNVAVANARGEITCFTIVGNQAWLGGVVTQATDPILVGRDIGFRVVDNGEGAVAVPDQFSLLLLTGADDYCANMHPTPQLIEVMNGNIQVLSRMMSSKAVLSELR